MDLPFASYLIQVNQCKISSCYDWQYCTSPSTRRFNLPPSSIRFTSSTHAIPSLPRAQSRRNHGAGIPITASGWMHVSPTTTTLGHSPRRITDGNPAHLEQAEHHEACRGGEARVEDHHRRCRRGHERMNPCERSPNGRELGVKQPFHEQANQNQSTHCINNGFSTPARHRPAYESNPTRCTLFPGLQLGNFIPDRLVWFTR